MAALVLIATLPAHGQPAPAPAPPPDRVCVSRALLDRWATYTAGRPWAEVSGLLDELRAEMRTPQACPAPEREPARP